MRGGGRPAGRVLRSGTCGGARALASFAGYPLGRLSRLCCIARDYPPAPARPLRALGPLLLWPCASCSGPSAIPGARSLLSGGRRATRPNGAPNTRKPDGSTRGAPHRPRPPAASVRSLKCAIFPTFSALRTQSAKRHRRPPPPPPPRRRSKPKSARAQSPRERSGRETGPRPAGPASTRAPASGPRARPEGDSGGPQARKTRPPRNRREV